MTAAVRRDVRLGTIAALPHDTRLSIADGITVNEWLEIGQELEKLGDSSAWWIGDWLAYGDRYRRDYHDAIAQVDERWSTYRVYRWVSQRVHPDTREKQLTWAHHRAVASLEREEQRLWLLDALAHGWKTRELEQAIARSRPDVQKPETLQLKATGELQALCARAAAARGVPPVQWALATLERAARLELEGKPIAPLTETT